MFDYFAWSFALRNLRYNPRQSMLTIGIVTTSVALIIFLTALISGLQKRLVGNVTDAIAHITIKPPERFPIPAWKLPEGRQGDVLYVGETIKLEQRKRKIEEWQTWLSRLEHFDPEVLAVSPVVEGQGILSRGEKHKGVAVTGVLPERHNQVVELQSKLVKGRFFGLNAGEITVGWKLADEFALQLGDKVRLVSSDDVAATYTVAGIFDTGFAAVDSATVFLPLRDAQSLFGLGTAVTGIGLKLDHIFEADALAARLAMQMPYDAQSWMKDNQSLLSGLRAQAQSSNLIVVFTAVAAGLGIASILVMVVVSKLRELGILKAMGATRVQILGAFTIQGTLLAAVGGIFGSAIGIALCLFLGRFKASASVTGRMVAVFPIDLSSSIVVQALGIALSVGFLASLYPAWRAARINPIEVIRAS
jgi:lipoprotein-releasing system permease protein